MDLQLWKFAMTLCIKNYLNNIFDKIIVTLTVMKKNIIHSLCFQNKDTITLGQAFLSIYILCKSDEASWNILGKLIIKTVTENIKDFRTNFKTRKF